MASATARVINIKRKAANAKPRHGVKHYLDRAEHADVDVTERELALLRKLVGWESPEEIAGAIGCSVNTLMRVCAGFIEHCRPETRRKFRRFLGERRAGGES